MDFEKLKADVKEIAEIAAAVPEKFRDKCFELLLSHLLNAGGETGNSGKGKESNNENERRKENSSNETIPVKAPLRVLMQKTDVTMEELARILIYDEGEVHFIKEPHDTSVATGQTEWALLLALKNTIEKGQLSTDPEQLRSICQEKGFYDPTNFATNLRAERNAKLFKNPLKSQGEAQPLSSAGQEALGMLIKKLSGVSK